MSVFFLVGDVLSFAFYRNDGREKTKSGKGEIAYRSFSISLLAVVALSIGHLLAYPFLGPAYYLAEDGSTLALKIDRRRIAVGEKLQVDLYFDDWYGKSVIGDYTLYLEKPYLDETLPFVGDDIVLRTGYLDEEDTERMRVEYERDVVFHKTVDIVIPSNVVSALLILDFGTYETANDYVRAMIKIRHDGNAFVIGEAFGNRYNDRSIPEGPILLSPPSLR